MRDARCGGAAQPERGRGQAAEFQETAPGNPLAAQHFVKGFGHGASPLWSDMQWRHHRKACAISGGIFLFP